MCFYIEDSLQVKSLPNIQNATLEMVWLEVLLGKDKIHFGCLYRPPKTLKDFWSTLEGRLEELLGQNLILMGDLNVNFTDKTDSQYNHLNYLCHAHQLREIIQQPTRITSTSAKCLDLILSNMVTLYNPTVVHVDFTDHCLVSASMKFCDSPLRKHLPPVQVARRRWKSAAGGSSAGNTGDRSSLLSDALSKHMNYLGATGVDNMWAEWRDKFTAALDDVAPKVSMRVNRKKPRCPWMTPKLLQILHKQKSMYRRVVRSHRQDNAAILQHRLLRNTSNNMYRQLKNEYFQTRLDEYRKSPAQLWSAINFITGRKNQHFPVSASIPDLETHFKSLFSNPGPPIAIPLGPANASAMLEFKSVSAAEVKRMLSDLVTSKAPGPDGILPSELKLVAGEIAPTIAILFNESLATGLLPEQFRMANLVPVFKPGKTDTSSANNYRGISLTCILSKVLEKIVFNQLNDYLTQCGALSDNQYGFRRGRSCADLLLTTLDDWYLAQDAKKFTAIAFIDLSKAFDNVRHELLLLTLQKVGVNGTVLAWFYNYLNNRQQQIVTQESSSTPFLCSKGVPQGSVLGPLLFNLYVSDLARLADERGASLPSFADDFTLYASCKDPVDACDTVSNVLGVLDKALDTLGLQINEIKTVAMLIPPQSDKSSCENCKIVLRGSELNLVSETRLLGVIIDSSLSWAANVDAVCRKLGRKIGALRLSFRQLTPFARRSFFISVIQPDLEYAALVSVPCMSATLRNRLLTVWRRAIRCAAGAAYQSDIDPILKENKITDLTNRWIVQYAVFVRRCYRMEAPPAACKKLQVTSHVYQTRGNTTTFRPHRPVCNAGVRSFSNRAPLLWNALSPDVRDASSTTKFKKNLLLFLQDENNCKTLNRLCFENPS